jgi:EAL domain-containing protein (putative c-di-GMP-specific phosphodiesterase class I)/GGDEF domain-containing protein
MTTADLAARLLATVRQPGILLDLAPASGGPAVVRVNAAASQLAPGADWSGLAEALGQADPDGLRGDVSVLDGGGRVLLRAAAASHRLDGRYVVVWLHPDGMADEPPVQPARPGPVLPGRAALSEAAEERRASPGEGGLALVGIDLRDRGGGAFAPDRLAEVSRHLSVLVREEDVVTHLGGGQFAALVSGVRNLDDVHRVEARLEAAAAMALPDRTRPVVAIATIVGLEPGVDLEGRLADLEEMLSESSSMGRTVRSGPAGPGGLATFPLTTHSFEAALAAGELLLHYQPVVNVHDQRSGGAEALIRWQHPSWGLLAPRRFLAMADREVGAMHLGEWVLDRAVRQTSLWDRATDLTYFRTGINLAPRQFADSNLVGTLARLLDRYEVPGSRFVLELLETEEIESFERVAKTIDGLHALGLRVAIDDFGSGFTSMAYLQKLPVDVIKVDRTLVGPYPTPRERAVLAAVCSVARTIGADVLLEGVERPGQLDAAREAGVTFAQGMLVGPPGPAGAMPPRPLPLPGD